MAGDTRAHLSHDKHDMGKTSIGLWGWFARFIVGGLMARDGSAERRFLDLAKEREWQTRERGRERKTR